MTPRISDRNVRMCNMRHNILLNWPKQAFELTYPSALWMICQPKGIFTRFILFYPWLSSPLTLFASSLILVIFFPLDPEFLPRCLWTEIRRSILAHAHSTATRSGATDCLLFCSWVSLYFPVFFSSLSFAQESFERAHKSDRDKLSNCIFSSSADPWEMFRLPKGGKQNKLKALHIACSHFIGDKMQCCNV